MNLENLIDSITPEIYQNLKHAVEVGKWPNGLAVSAEQRQYAIQAVIAYDEKHLSEEQRVGFIHTETHSHCGTDAETAKSEENEWQTLTIK